MDISQVNKGKIVIMKEKGYSLSEISVAIGIPVKDIEAYLKQYKTGKI